LITAFRQSLVTEIAVALSAAVGYFAMMADFARSGRLAGSYGDAKIDRPAAASR